MLNDALYGSSDKIDIDELIKEINMLRTKLGWALLDTGQTLDQVVAPIVKMPTSTATQTGAMVEKDIGVIVDTSTKASVSVTQKIGIPKEKGHSQVQQTGQPPRLQPQPKRCDKPDGQGCQ